MAKNKCVVYLGYEDEAITDKNKSFVDYKTNKCGGFPVRKKYFLCCILFGVFFNFFFQNLGLAFS